MDFIPQPKQIPWSVQQVSALNALGIPLFVRRTEYCIANEAVIEKATAEVTQTETAPSYLYQIGPWYVSSPAELAIPYYDWLSDLCRYMQAQPTHIKQAPEHHKVFDLEPYLRSTLLPSEKKQLWQLLNNEHLS